MKTAYIKAISEMLEDYSEEYLFNMLVKMGQAKYNNGGVPQHLADEAAKKPTMIEAIKFLRNSMGELPGGSMKLGLREAKDFCDKLKVERGLWPDRRY